MIMTVRRTALAALLLTAVTTLGCVSAAPNAAVAAEPAAAIENYLLRDAGIVCIRAPCPTWTIAVAEDGTEHRLNLIEFEPLIGAREDLLRERVVGAVSQHSGQIAVIGRLEDRTAPNGDPVTVFVVMDLQLPD